MLTKPESSELRLDEKPVVQEFFDVFPDELSRLPSKREIEFAFEVQSTDLIAIPPYRMAPTELKELETQLRELLNKGFIRPSVSP